jgi:hypothetical protein
MKIAESMKVMDKILCLWQSIGVGTNGGSNVNIKREINHD